MLEQDSKFALVEFGEAEKTGYWFLQGGDWECRDSTLAHTYWYPEDITQEDFEYYCLKPAMEMRSVIKKQLCIIDSREFDVPGKRTIPEVVYNP